MSLQDNPSSFRVLLESRSIVNPIDIKAQQQQQSVPPTTRRNEWRFRPGAYTPRDFVREIAILLESVITQLGPDGPEDANTRAILMDGLRSSLSHEGREATLPLSDWNSDEPSDLTRHILRVGKALFQYASEASHGVPGDPSLTVYSPCEGHKWVPPAGRLLRSHRSSPILMMLYNEWLHQFTCLRDILIGIENFEEVVLNLDNPSRQGTRPAEDVREALLAQLKSGDVSRSAFLEAVKTLTAPSLPVGGYGFQFDRGVVLPAAVFSRTASHLLFRYSPSRLVPEPSHQPVLLVPGPPLETTAKVELDDLEVSASPAEIPLQTSITSEKTAASDGEQVQYFLKLITTRGQNKPSFSVDLANAILGLDTVTDATELEEREILAASGTKRVYTTSDVLLAGPGIVQNLSADSAVIRVTEEVHLLALLGKLDPRGVRLGGRWKRRDSKPFNTDDERRTESPRFLIVA